MGDSAFSKDEDPSENKNENPKDSEENNLFEIDPEETPPKLPLPFVAYKGVSVTFLERFKERMLAVFTYFIQDTAPLKGRVEEIIPKVQETLEALHKVDEHILKTCEKNPKVKPFQSIIIQPLIDRARKINKRWQNNAMHLRVKAFDETKQWMEESEYWIDFYWNKSIDELLSSLRESMQKEALKRVDRDIKIIQDYEQQTFEKLNVGASDKQHLKDLLEELLLKPIATLGALKHSKEDLNLEEIDLWNKELDEKRQRLFNETLAIIDAVVHDYKPEFAIEEDHHHLIDVIERINVLENRLRLLQEAIARNKDSSVDEPLKELVLIIQNEIHSLSLDLRLPQSLFERLEKAEATLTEILKKHM